MLRERRAHVHSAAALIKICKDPLLSFYKLYWNTLIPLFDLIQSKVCFQYVTIKEYEEYRKERNSHVYCEASSGFQHD